MTTEEFYTSPHWRAKRKAVLRRDGYIDQVAKRYGKTLDATIVHHIFPLEEYPEYRLADWNLISVSMATHNRLHDRETRRLSGYGLELMRRTGKKMGIQMIRITLVIGLPGTGKTTYVREHLGDGIAYDLDYIAAAFRLTDVHSERHDDARRMANDLVEGFARNVLSYTSNAFVVRSSPSVDELEQINPDKIVICTREHDITMRNDYVVIDTEYMKRTISNAIKWAEKVNIPVEYINA